MWGVLVMNKKFFKDTITLFLLDEENENYDRVIIHNVYFRHNKKTNLIDKGLEKGSTGSITIPAKIATIDDNLAIYTYSNIKTTSILDFVLDSILTDNTWNLKNDSYVVEGVVYQEFDLSKIQENYQVFKIVSVDDNRKGGLPHLKIGVSE